MFDTSQRGPLYEDFSIGATLPPLPSVTVTDADSAIYRMVTGDQHSLSADAELFRAVGGVGTLANPALVMQYSIGQTTMATRLAIANLYYRSVRMLRPVTVGESLRTETTVLGLADATPKNGAQRGKVWLGIVTSAANEPVITYERCALIRSESAEPLGHASVIPGPSESVALRELYPAVPTWRIDLLPESGWAEGQTRIDPLRDHIDLAAPFARLTFNQAAIHRDATTSANGQRLVYGGHVQGLAQASLTRMLPSLATVLAWDGCDHLAPAAEGDLLEFHHTLIEELPVGTGRILRLETIGARVEESGQTKDILRWTPVVWAR